MKGKHDTMTNRQDVSRWRWFSSMSYIKCKCTIARIASAFSKLRIRETLTRTASDDAGDWSRISITTHGIWAFKEPTESRKILVFTSHSCPEDTIADFSDLPLKVIVFHLRGVHAEPGGKQCLFLWRHGAHREISAIFSKSPLVYHHQNIFSSSNHISVLSEWIHRHPCSVRSSFLKFHKSFKTAFTFVWFSHLYVNCYRSCGWSSWSWGKHLMEWFKGMKEKKLETINEGNSLRSLAIKRSWRMW